MVKEKEKDYYEVIINQTHVRKHKKDNWGIKDSSSQDKNSGVHFIALTCSYHPYILAIF